MVLDYHEKRNTQKISERKPIQKNRPTRRTPLGLYLVIGVTALSLAYGAGFLTGKVMYKGKAPAVAALPVVQNAPKKEDPAKGEAKAPAVDPPLTFYKTLPAGSKGVIGSGINLKKPEASAPAPHPAAPSAAPSPQDAAASPASQGAKAAPPASAQSVRYMVQVASYRDKAEAEAAMAKLAERGIAAYLNESNAPDKGVWFRLRVGKHLSREEAEQLSAKAGKGAVVLAE